MSSCSFSESGQCVVMLDVSPIEQPRAENAKLGQLKDLVAVLTERVAQLGRETAADYSNSSRPPSSDTPWAKKPAKRKRTLSDNSEAMSPSVMRLSRALKTIL